MGMFSMVLMFKVSSCELVIICPDLGIRVGYGPYTIAFLGYNAIWLSSLRQEVGAHAAAVRWEPRSTESGLEQMALQGAPGCDIYTYICIYLHIHLKYLRSAI